MGKVKGNASIATPVNDGYALLKCIIKHDIGGQTISNDLLNYLTTVKNVPLKPRYTFKKRFINTDGQEVMQLVDLTGSDKIKNTHESYLKWSQMEIAREMKEDFLSVSEELLTQKLQDQSRIASYELPDGSQVQLNAFERHQFMEKLF